MTTESRHLQEGLTNTRFWLATTTVKLASGDFFGVELVFLASTDLTDADDLGLGPDGGLGVTLGDSGGVTVSSMTATLGVAELRAGVTGFLAGLAGVPAGVTDFSAGVEDFSAGVEALLAGDAGIAAGVTDLEDWEADFGATDFSVGVVEFIRGILAPGVADF